MRVSAIIVAVCLVVCALSGSADAVNRGALRVRNRHAARAPAAEVPAAVALTSPHLADALTSGANPGADEAEDTDAVTEGSALTEASSEYHSIAASQDHREPVPPPQFARRRPAPAASAPAPAPALVATSSATTATAKRSSLSTAEAITNYNEFLSRNFRFAQSEMALFKMLDLNGDGKIDLKTELPRAVESGVITPQHAATVRSFDANCDGCVVEKEWMMGPLFVQLLQFNPTKRAEYERVVASDGDTTEFAKMYGRILNGDASDLPRFAEMRFAVHDTTAKTEEELHLAAEEAEHNMQETTSARADDTARFAARHGRRRRHNPERMSNKAARALELLAQQRPRSKHGIPSEADEHCVMCQFVVQRIQKQLYFTLSNGNNGFPADPNAEIPAKKMRQTNSQLLNRRGGKGMLRILAEDIVSDMCEADQMPELYYSACKKLDKAFPTLLDAIYFQFHSEAVCEEAKLCGKATYFNAETSVHLPSKSIVFNSGRGKCGLMGGAHERADAFFSAAICFAGSIFIESSAVTNAHSF